MDLTTLHFILIFVFPISIIFLFSNISSKQQQSQPSNGLLRPYPIVGNLPQLLRHRHRFLDWMTELLSASPTNTISFHVLSNVRGIITANPSNVEHILKTNFDNYPKGPRFIHHLQDFLGRGIVNVDGHLWRVQRKTVSFEFNTRSLRNFVVVNVQHEILSRLLPLLRKSSRTGAAIDLQDVLERFAFDNICKFAFNEDPVCLSDHDDHVSENNLLSRFAQAFKSAAELSAGRFTYAVPWFWIITRLLNIGTERQLRESIATVHAFATQIIRSRKKEKNLHDRADDLLSRFISNEDNTDDELLRDIIISFTFAGREGTSSALTWFFWLLSRHPEVEHKILQEISAVRAARRQGGGDNSTETFEFEELREMQYLHAAISEAMRLYPPLFVNSTMCQSDDVLPDGTLIKKGMFVVFSAYCMGRMESIWGKDCLEFKPERWLDGEGAFRNESPYRYPVFHAGPRMCLGKEMAYIQMKSIAAFVLERFMVDVLHKDKEPERVPSLTLKMKHGLFVGIRDRN
ncbi:hypothetical protein J5N97_027927 [Dioscorea zingiberensis]|uniref:Cytochrome P450 n=1 Tax=Dioscorea zingiberensis TaxID=325984 RepID=A0A9D5H480_9LILI|nr:hypothetical protein J5N97_027927 [Dioscorea zingiberensis]